MHNDVIGLTLPYPPSVNTYKTIGRTIRTKTGKIYQQKVNSPLTKRFYYEVWMAVRQKTQLGFGSAPISLDIEVYPPDKRKRDLDNILKVLIDSLQKANVFDDDSQVSRLFVERRSIISQGQIIVRIQRYAQS